MITYSHLPSYCYRIEVCVCGGGGGGEGVRTRGVAGGRRGGRTRGGVGARTPTATWRTASVLTYPRTRHHWYTVVRSVSMGCDSGRVSLSCQNAERDAPRAQRRPAVRRTIPPRQDSGQRTDR